MSPVLLVLFYLFCLEENTFCCYSSSLVFQNSSQYFFFRWLIRWCRESFVKYRREKRC